MINVILLRRDIQTEDWFDEPEEEWTLGMIFWFVVTIAVIAFLISCFSHNDNDEDNNKHNDNSSNYYDYD
jgi:hypothetical protein